MTAVLKQKGFQPKLTVISKSPQSVLFEWQIVNHPTQSQDEPQRVIQTGKGLHVIHYASRPTMSAEHRKSSIRILTQAQAK